MAGDADLLFVGGRIFTGARDGSRASAMAIASDRIVAVGSEAQVGRWTGPRTRRVDLRERVIVPGFVDAHAHLADAAGELGWTRLGDSRDLDTALARLRKTAARTPPGQWVLGEGWDEAKWPERRYPTREDLDRVSLDHPVVARRVDCHMGSVNSRAFALAGDLAQMRGFEVDPSGRPTGVLKEDAFEAFGKRFAADETQIGRRLSSIARMAHKLGITSVQDIVDLAHWRAYVRTWRSGNLRLRIYAMPRDALLSALIGAGLRTGFGDAWLRLGAIKVFSDGSLGAYTAALREPYQGRPGDRGMLVHSREELTSLLRTAHRAGFQTATHAIGDEAIDQVIGALETIQGEDPRMDARHRIEHFELPDEDLLRRAKRAGLVASCQPNFVGQWSGPGDVYETRLGAARAATNNPYRKILGRRIPLCFGSDGMPYGPLYGIHSAVNGFFEDQRISAEDAFRAATAGGAHASFEEGLKGTLEAGKLADFVVLAGNPFAEPEQIANVRVHSTWIGGQPVYRSPGKR